MPAQAFFPGGLNFHFQSQEEIDQSEVMCTKTSERTVQAQKCVSKQLLNKASDVHIRNICSDQNSEVNKRD